jgi:hypothetical protein
VTTGSMTLVSDLIAAGLVDEYRLFMDTDVVALRLVESRSFRSGIVLLRYRSRTHDDAP